MWDDCGKFIAVILGAYLLGALPHLYIMGKMKGVDLRQYEDMHIALWRHVGRLWGFIGIMSDFAKGVIAVLVARSIGFDPGWVAFAGVIAVAGQMWPIFMNFDGEKGNSTGLAMSATLATKALLIALIPLIIGFAIRTIPRFLAANQSTNERLKFGGPPSNSLPLGMLITFAVLPLISVIVGQPWEVSLCLLVLFLLIIIRRMTAGVSEEIHQSSLRKNALLNRMLFDRSDI